MEMMDETGGVMGMGGGVTNSDETYFSGGIDSGVGDGFPACACVQIGYFIVNKNIAPM